MSWFVDASVVVALSIREPDWEQYAGLIDREKVCLWSPIARWESIVATQLRMGRSAIEAEEIVTRVARANSFRTVAIGEEEAEMAAEAHRRYGRGSGSKAKLNMGDCFAYACARTNGARLLYKGDDFAQTDMAL